MEKRIEKKLLLSPPGRVSFHSVFEPSAMEEGQEKKYGLTLLFPKKFTNPEHQKRYNDMIESADEICLAKFGCKLSKKQKGDKTVANPFHDGEEKEQLDGYGPEVNFVRFSNRLRPCVVNLDKSAIDPRSNVFYNGCWAHVMCNAYFYTKGKNGIAWSLGNVQKIGDGEPFGASATNPDDDFEEISDGSYSDLADEYADLVS